MTIISLKFTSDEFGLTFVVINESAFALRQANSE